MALNGKIKQLCAQRPVRPGSRRIRMDAICIQLHMRYAVRSGRSKGSVITKHCHMSAVCAAVDILRNMARNQRAVLLIAVFNLNDSGTSRISMDKYFLPRHFKSYRTA